MRGVRGAAVIVGVLLGASAASACILKADGFTGGTPPADGATGGGGDGGESSGGPADGAALVGPDADSGGTTSGGSPDSGGTGSTQPNLLLNGDFELGCAGWNVAFGFVSEASVAHGGAGSCKFCMDTNFEAILSRSAALDAHAGGTYVGDIWYQAASSVSALDAAGYVGASLQMASPGGDLADPTNGPVLDGSYQHVTTLITLSHDTQSIELRLHMQQSGNPAAQGNVICLYVDDAAIRRVP